MQQIDLMRLVIRAFGEVQVPYALVGSMASGVWGEPRMTLDIDVVARFKDEVECFCKVFSDDEFYVSVPAAIEAVRLGSQFNVIHNASGQKVDVMTIADTPWSQNQIRRRREAVLVEGVKGYIAAPEDIILGKLIYYREGGSDKHLRDIRGVLENSSEIIDRVYLEEWVKTLGVIEAWGEAQEWIRDNA